MISSLRVSRLLSNSFLSTNILLLSIEKLLLPFANGEAKEGVAKQRLANETKTTKTSNDFIFVINGEIKLEVKQVRVIFKTRCFYCLFSGGLNQVKQPIHRYQKMFVVLKKKPRNTGTISSEVLK